MKHAARKISALAILLCVLGAPRANAQSRVVAFTYVVSLPGSETKEFIDEVSYRGAEIAFRLAPFYETPFLIGVTMGWEVFYSESRDPIEFDRGTVSGEQRRTLNAFPILFSMHWYFGGDEGLRVFAGGGIGPTYCIQRFGIGVYDFENGEWHFTAAPEVGVQYPMGGAELYLSARYNYCFESGSTLVAGESAAWNFTSIGIGLAWSGW